jgi:uncharacterized repeat protein (TIGR03803 family)
MSTMRKSAIAIMFAALWLCASGCQAAPQTNTIGDPGPAFTTLHSFHNTDGAHSQAALVQATDGNLYGATAFGGANEADCIDGCGTIFRITPSGTLTTLYNFCSQSNCTDGANPEAAMIEAASGDLYGTTSVAGPGGDGTVFKITSKGALTTLYGFGGADGADPNGLVQAANGNFYGTTQTGGDGVGCLGGCGTVFSITPAGTLTTLYSFCAQSGCKDGAIPEGALVEAASGDFYGVTRSGGTYDWGTVFEITASGTLTTLHSFCSLSGCADGKTLDAGLVAGTDGELYGTTVWGGPNNACAYGCGTIFKIASSGGPLTTLYAFCSQDDCADGYYPGSALVQATDGNFYGTTGYGGSNDYDGTIFKITPDGKLTTLHAFDSTDGANPAAALTEDTNGSFYGTTQNGGSSGACTSGCGTVFSLAVGLEPFVETEPVSGKVGATVNILGTSLTGATSVTFNGTAAVFKVIAGSEIAATVPTGATSGKVQVTTPGGILSSNLPFHVLP